MRETSILNARLREISEILAPATDEEILKFIEQKMHPLFASKPDKEKLKAYLSLLRNFPIGAIKKAVSEYAKKGKAFAPEPAELTAEVRKIINPTLTEQCEIMMRLNAEVEPEKKCDPAKVDEILRNFRRATA